MKSDNRPKSKTQKLDKSNIIKTAGKVVSEYNFVLIFIVMLVVFLAVSSGLSWTGVTNILRHSSVVGVMALGMAIVIITKGIDLSVGSMLALTAGIAVVVFNDTGSIPLTLITCLILGALCGFFNGILIGKAKLPAFIVTLSTMLMFRSLAQYLARSILNFSIYMMDASLPARKELFDFGQSAPLTIPMTGWILVLVTIIMVVVTKQTKFGKSIYAVGSNEKAARLAGINVDWIIVMMYTITGVLVGIAAFLWLAMNTSADPATIGRSNEMYAIAAVVIGGVSMNGGKGKVLGVLFGAMSYSIIDKIIISLRLDSLINDTIKGAILLIAIAIQLSIPVIRNKITAHKLKKEASKLAESVEEK